MSQIIDSATAADSHGIAAGAAEASLKRTIESAYAGAPTDRREWLRSLDLQMTIDGRPAPVSRRRTVVDPSTEAALVEYPEASTAELDRAVAAARAAAPGWAATDWEDRRASLDRFADLVHAHAAALSWALACESGRPLRRALSEVTITSDYLRIIAGCRLPDRSYDRPGIRTTLTHRPLGVVGAIAPWNAPVILAAAKIANALLAGNTLVLRPSPFTPLSALYLGMLGREVLPPGVLNVITGDAAVSAALVEHPGVAKISFTGSTATGKRIAAAAAPRLKRLTLELGGNDAAVVLPDADLQAVAETVFTSSLGNCGHFCAAVKRLYVHDSVHDALCDALIARCEGARLGDGFDPATTVGAIQNRPQFDRIWALFDDAVAAGAHVLTGGTRHAGPGLFIPPTLVGGLVHGVRLVDEEQFGPVLPIIRFHDVDDALRLANDSEYGLGGSIWTANLDVGVALARRLEVGTAWINQHGGFSAALPMPFAKQSGIGIDYAEYGLAEHSQRVLVNARLLA